MSYLFSNGREWEIMVKVYIDVDNVIRDLDIPIFGERAPVWYNDVRGMKFVDYVTKNRRKLLKDTPECEYAEPLKEWIKVVGTAGLAFLSCQPDEWLFYTERWLRKRFPKMVYIFTKRPEDKLIIVESQKGILIDDYPLYKDYRRIAVVDRPYNQHVKANCRIKGPMEFVLLLAKCRWDNE